jgi:hypothetical protein
MKWILIVISVLLLVPCLSESIQSKVDSATQQAVINYLEQQLPTFGGGKNFVAFDFFGQSTHGKTNKVYGYCDRQSFALVDNQVLERSGGLSPMVVLVEQTEEGPKVTAYNEPEPGGLFLPSVKQMFPRRFQEIAGNLPEDRQKVLEKQIRTRVLSYFADKVKERGTLKKQKPSNLTDPHKHKEDIYSCLNLEAPYRQIYIQPNPAKVSRTGGGKPLGSPDGRIAGWTASGGDFDLYFEDDQTHTVYGIGNKTNKSQSNLAWKGDHILVFDQINGVNRIGDWETEGVQYGVHIELDAEKREIIWAVPFGVLGFPKKQ